MFIQKEKLYQNVHSGFTHSHREVKVTCTSVSRDTDKQSVAHAHSGTPRTAEGNGLLTHIEWLAFKSIRLSERSHTQQIINYDYISVTWWNRQTCRHRKHISSCLE